jgi:diguanylate cyclase (GGDEF)-like protein
MKKWVEKLVNQFDFEWSDDSPENGKPAGLNEDRATLLFLLDVYNKHLLDIEGHPIRRVRETLDGFAKELIAPKEKNAVEDVLFRFRQFFGGYRIDETKYVEKTFDELRAIIWEFVNQLSDELGEEQKDDFEVRETLEDLKEAVESNSIVELKTQSRKFIDKYLEKQVKKDKRRTSRMKSIRKNLNKVKQQLGEAQNAASTDHLTQAFNRKTFDEYAEQHWKFHQALQGPVSLIMVDIDHFKKINDTYGHDVGDFVLKELVGWLKGMFTRESDLVARLGGEEFAILLPDYTAQQAMVKAEELMAKVRREAYVHNDQQIRFTVSIGISQLIEGEDVAAWVKRADLALYHSKNTGRNRATLAPTPLKAA